MSSLTPKFKYGPGLEELDSQTNVWPMGLDSRLIGHHKVCPCPQHSRRETRGNIGPNL